MTDIFWFFLYGIGALIGYGIATYVSGSREGVSGRIPSLRFQIGQYTMWIHHWIYCSIIIAVMVLLGWNHPLWYGMGAGAVAQGLHYRDWYYIFFKTDRYPYT